MHEICAIAMFQGNLQSELRSAINFVNLTNWGKHPFLAKKVIFVVNLGKFVVDPRRQEMVSQFGECQNWL